MNLSLRASGHKTTQSNRKQVEMVGANAECWGDWGIGNR